MNDVQIPTVQLDRHDLQSGAGLVVSEEQQPFVLVVDRRRDAEDQAAMLDDESASRAFDSMLGR